MKAWSQQATFHPKASERAEEILNQMEQEFQPNLISYTIVMNAWAAQASSLSSTEQQQQHAAERAETILNQMYKSNNPKSRPDLIAYNIL